MIRTFHSKVDRKTLCFCLLPGTVLAVYFFWIKQPLPALCAMVFLVFVVERLIHTSYVFTDDGHLLVCRGRFAKVRRLRLDDISRAEVVRAGGLSFLRHKDTVALTLRDGTTKLITPSPAEEFCRYLRKRRDGEARRA